MSQRKLYIPERTAALDYAAKELEQAGISIQSEDYGNCPVLLPVPCKEPHCYPGRTVFCGFCQNLICETKIDLLEEQEYVMQNAALTAYCAENLIRSNFPDRIDTANILIIGWGRIGKCLALRLKAYCHSVTISSRSKEKCCLCRALGFQSQSPTQKDFSAYEIIINTAPANPPIDISASRKDALIFDLASIPGIIGSNIRTARGLPGIMAPKANGKRIAEAVLRNWE